MSKKSGIIVSVLSITAILISVITLIFCLTTAQNSTANADTEYIIYLGTNDKDSNQPKFAPDEAKEKLQDILIGYFSDYTLQNASGRWVDGDTKYQEHTLVIHVSNVNLEKVHKAADELLKEFNQVSVLIQADSVVTEFYSGKS